MVSGIPNRSAQEIFLGTDSERKIVAERYKVMNPSSLEFKNGGWHMSGIPIEQWDALMNEKDDLYRH